MIQDLGAFLKQRVRGPDDKILIVGGRSTNFPDRLRAHPQLIFWDSTDPVTARQLKIPVGVRVIITTRFVDHALIARIQSLAESAGVERYPGTLGTGEIKTLLGRALGISEDVGRGELKDFVIRHARFDTDMGTTEIKRLYELAQKQGIPTTQDSVGQAFYRLRREWRQNRRTILARREELKLQEVEPEGARPRKTPAPSPAPAVPEGHVEQSIEVLRDLAGRLLGSIDELRKWLDQFQLASVALEEVLQDHARLRLIEADYARLQKMEGEMRDLRARLDSLLNGRKEE